MDLQEEGNMELSDKEGRLFSTDRIIADRAVIDRLRSREETLWINPDRLSFPPRSKVDGYGFIPVKAAQSRMMRFIKYIARAFPETRDRVGVIESNLIEIPAMREWLNENGADIRGRLFLKDDAHLPIAGSVKARGGIHEVMKIAEYVGQKEDKLWPADDYSKIDSDEFREMYSHYTIQVGSTGNLGISIGRMAAKLGFRAVVHMSSDAKQWKKDLLRSEGVIVKEYGGDYSEAVSAGRRESENDPNSFFVDDENSEDLFFGYATAALRVKSQFRRLGITVDEQHPLFLYLPCGVGGAPGGITYGFRQLFGDHAHCFFAEPVEAPCFLLGMASGKMSDICVQDIGLTGRTQADGLAVARPSAFSCARMKPMMAGAFTVSDEKMALYQKKIRELEEIRLEISGCAGFEGPVFGKEEKWKQYLEDHNLTPYMDQAVHIVWGTGGGLMPD